MTRLIKRKHDGLYLLTVGWGIRELAYEYASKEKAHRVARRICAHGIPVVVVVRHKKPKIGHAERAFVAFHGGIHAEGWAKRVWRTLDSTTRECWERAVRAARGVK